jgi:hypothetical protein
MSYDAPEFHGDLQDPFYLEKTPTTPFTPKFPDVSRKHCPLLKSLVWILPFNWLLREQWKIE